MRSESLSVLKRRVPVWVGFITLAFVAIALRVPGLDRPVVGDEQTTLALAGQRGDQIVRDLIAYDAHPPLYPVMIGAWSSVSRRLWWIRTFSLICIVAAVLVLVALARRLFGEDIAWSAGMLAACSPHLIFLSQYARPYAFAILLGMLAAVSAVRWLEQAPGSGRVWLAVTMLCLAALLYTFYLSIFVFTAIGIAVGIGVWHTRRAQLGWWIGAVLLAWTAWLLWLPAYAAQMQNLASGASSSTPLLKQAGMGAFLGSVQVGALAKPVLALWQIDEPRALTTRLSAHLSDWRLITALLVGLAVTGLIAVVSWRTLVQRQRLAGIIGLIYTLVGLPILGAGLLSLAGDLGYRAPVAVNVRYFGDSALWMTVIVASALSAIRNRTVSRVLLCLAVGGMLIQLPRLYRYPFQDQPAMLAALDKAAVTGVISAPQTSIRLLDRQGRAHFSSHYEEWVLEPGQEGRVAAQAAGHKHLAILEQTTAERIAAGSGMMQAFEEQLQRTGFRKTGQRRISDMLMIRVYHRGVQ